MRHNGIKTSVLARYHDKDSIERRFKFETKREYTEQCAEYLDKNCELNLSPDQLQKIVKSLEDDQVNKVSSLKDRLHWHLR